jgi:PAS domain S-box-containing protein
MLELTGHTRAEFEGDMWDWATFTPPEFMSLDDAAIRAARTNGFWEPYEKEYVHRDGKRVPVRLSSVPVPGEPGRVIVCVEDLSREKAARTELEAQIARLELALSAAELGVFEWRMTDMSAVWGNDRMYEIFARAPEQGPIPCDTFLRQVLHPDDRPAFKAQIVAAAAGTPFTFKGRVVRDDGVERRIASRGFFERAGEGLRLVGVLADITDEA